VRKSLSSGSRSTGEGPTDGCSGLIRKSPSLPPLTPTAKLLAIPVWKTLPFPRVNLVYRMSHQRPETQFILNAQETVHRQLFQSPFAAPIAFGEADSSESEDEDEEINRSILTPTHVEFAHSKKSNVLQQTAMADFSGGVRGYPFPTINVPEYADNGIDTDDVFNQDLSLQKVALVLMRDDEMDLASAWNSGMLDHRVGMIANVQVYNNEERSGKDFLEMFALGERRFRLVRLDKCEEVEGESAVCFAQIQELEDRVSELTRLDERGLRKSLIVVAQELLKQVPEKKQLVEHTLENQKEFDIGEFADALFGIFVDEFPSSSVFQVVHETAIMARSNLVLHALRQLVDYKHRNNDVINIDRFEEIASVRIGETYKDELFESFKQLHVEMGIDESDADPSKKFNDRLSNLDIPESARKVIKSNIEQLKHKKKAGSNATDLHTYLDFVTSLPWGLSTTDNTDIERAQHILDEDHYGMPLVKDRILEWIAISALKGDFSTSGKIVCIHGPPGTGMHFHPEIL
jgi:ATP-dependent Lon protease